MIDPEDALKRALAWIPSSFISANIAHQNQLSGHRKFGSTEHLASEAVAAYVDGELRMNAYLRAAQHLAECAECASEVEAQQQARAALRGSSSICIPQALLGVLSRIPDGQQKSPLLPGTPGEPLAGGPVSASDTVGRRKRR
ncbi:MAG: anti-sigma E factor RseA [Mycobacteriaceae bacterium]